MTDPIDPQTAPPMTAEIWHNPRCGTSRDTLAMILQAGVDARVVDYLATPPSRQALAEVIAAAGVTVREALRANETSYAELGLGDASLTDEALLDAMVAHPILIQRPFVSTPLGVRLCRPAARVLEILPR